MTPPHLDDGDIRKRCPECGALVAWHPLYDAKPNGARSRIWEEIEVVGYRLHDDDRRITYPPPHACRRAHVDA